MSDTVTISVKAYNELMATLLDMQVENKRIKHVLSIYKKRVMTHHESVCTEYGSYFSSKDHASMDRLASEIATKKVDTVS